MKGRWRWRETTKQKSLSISHSSESFISIIEGDLVLCPYEWRLIFEFPRNLSQRKDFTLGNTYVSNRLGDSGSFESSLYDCETYGDYDTHYLSGNRDQDLNTQKMVGSILNSLFQQLNVHPILESEKSKEPLDYIVWLLPRVCWSTWIITWIVQ